MAAAVSTVSQKACTETRGAGAMCSPGPHPARVAWRSSSRARITCPTVTGILLAQIADLALVRIRIDGLRGLAAVVLVEHRGAASGIGRDLAARLDEVGLVLDHGSKIALRGAAEIPVLHVLVVLAVGGRAKIVRPQPARPGLCHH